MSLQEYLQSIDFPLKKLTVAYPVRESEVLLAKKVKKGGLGEGYFLGIGGKVEEGETWEQGAIREIQEEIGIETTKLSDRGFVNFYFPGKEKREKWNFKTKIYIVEEWKGEPVNSDEMEPEWFTMDSVPYKDMWDDNRYFLPRILEGRTIEAHMMYDEKGERIQEYSIKFIDV